MDRRVARTRASIKKAYLELIKEKGASRVTVSDISRRADIDRKTFYLHYGSPDDVLDEHIEERFNEVTCAMERSDYFSDPFDAGKMIDLLDSFYKEEEDLLVAAADSDSYNELWKHVHDILSDKVIALYAPDIDLPEDELKIYFDFYGSGVIEAYRRWVRGEYDFDLHRLVLILSEIGQNGLRPHFTK